MTREEIEALLVTLPDRLFTPITVNGRLAYARAQVAEWTPSMQQWAHTLERDDMLDVFYLPEPTP